MQMTDVDLDAPLFDSHPAGWQSPNEIASGFALAWALELRERQRLTPQYPEADWVQEHLPARFRYDTLGQLIRLWPGTDAATFRNAPVVRLTALAGTWTLFDILNREWQIRPDDFHQFAGLLAYVTGDRSRPSLYGDLRADISKCLLAVRVRRAAQGLEELDLTEQWFVNGDEELTFDDQQGNTSLLFHFDNSTTIPLAIFAHAFPESIWSTARVTVDRLGPENVISENRGRVDSLIELLERGAAAAERAKQEMPRIRWQQYNYWPGWS